MTKDESYTFNTEDVGYSEEDVKEWQEIDAKEWVMHELETDIEDEQSEGYLPIVVTYEGKPKGKITIDDEFRKQWKITCNRTSSI